MQQNRQHIWIAGLLLLGIVVSLAGCAREVPEASDEPAATEPAATEPADAEPADAEPAATEPADAEPTATEPADAEPAATEPAATEPAATEPAATEPAATEPAATEAATSVPAAGVPADAETPTASAPADLAGTSWILESFGAADDPQPVLEDSEIITLLFDEQGGTLAGNAGCNQYQGSYEHDDDQLSVGALISTRMACVEPEGVMEQERAYLAALQSAESYQAQDEQLTITYADDSELVFRAYDTPAETTP